jgi:hypothetical protein
MKFIKILLLTAAIASGVIAIVFYITNQITKPAEEFFMLLSQEKYSEAWEMTHPDYLQAQISKDDFTKLMIKYNLKEFDSISWSTRRLKNGAGMLTGNCTLKDGSIIDITLNFLPHNDVYKITKMVLPPKEGISIK